MIKEGGRREEGGRVGVDGGRGVMMEYSRKREVVMKSMRERN